MEEYVEVNRASWDERASAHAASPDYRVAELLADPTALSHVVEFDLPRLGDLSGLDVVHLQCHIGTDTLSLHRLGARMTGLDFSGESLAQARLIAGQAGASIEYVQAQVYDARTALGEASYDVVYTGVGALCWLPSIERWAATVASLLRPGGRLFLREGHPMLWSVDDEREDDLLVVRYPYFEREEPTVADFEGTYVETDHHFTATTTHDWNHGLGEIVTALLGQGFEVTGLEEHDSAPWAPFPGRTPPHPDLAGEYRLTDRPERLPMTYTLQAVKRG